MRLINTHDQLRAAVKAGTIAKDKAVAVGYSARPSGRMGWGECSKSCVWSPFFSTDEDAHWMNNGSKVFLGNRKASLEAAKQWASEQYGITQWARNRMGDFVPAEVNTSHPIPKPDSGISKEP